MPPTTAQEPSVRRTLDGTSRKPARVWSRDDAVLERIVELLRAGLPLDDAYDALEDVLGERARPDAPEVEAQTQKLRGIIQQLVDLALERRDDPPSEDVTALVARAQALRAEEPPTDGAQARGHLRRLALVTQDVLEALDEDDEQ
ncbi:DUF6415 family natural product biosynthesis protein [Streptomyces sp. NPDC048479]|uniref:DUF6415 family natural product biosynthesis protein n=1 Tax=Streptomyces sp. NPDC048479 TaxID=3154725 RepID=UPI00343283FD